ncbi:sigma-70 family RNA polymerase sigma factor [Okeania sp. SIO2B3]|uniref:sigma-70 family RNA polymerase sigma factor n=1 Tax=Okeania sp. SIO2B3 TaxID=2607784 RepID=UPI0013C23B2E|nr:sigma-70 family RNA polymerase sigma factor [Okeania sp. SIO2B3]NET45444.1 sigma-70 family RNA polymerase sigma factor [Okeania sp. SIO2B3]
MEKRTNILNMFSTFLDVQDDYGNSSKWLYDKKLKSNIEQQQKNRPSLNGNLEQYEPIWVKFWYDLAVVENGSISIPQRHLQSYLQECCFWATKEIHNKFASDDDRWIDGFYQAINFVLEKTLKIFEKYNWIFFKPTNIRSWCQQKIKDYLKEFYLKRRRLDGASDWRILKDKNISSKKWGKVLESARILDVKLSSCLLALECFQKHYHPIVRANQRFPEPTDEQWKKIVNDYNYVRNSRGITNDIDREAIQKLLDECVNAMRNYQKPQSLVYIDDEEKEYFEIASDDSFREEKLEKDQEWQEINNILTDDFTKLSPEAKTLLILENGIQLGQTEIAKLFNLKQYQISRKLTKYRKPLLDKCVKMKQEQVERKLTKEENKNLSKQINEWLRYSCCKQDFYEILEDLLTQTSSSNLKIMSLYYIETFSMDKKSLEEKSASIKKEIAEKLEITDSEIEKCLTDSRNYLLERLKRYINDNLELPKELDSNLIPTLDETLLKFIDEFLKKVSYAQLFEKIKINNL